MPRGIWSGALSRELFPKDGPHAAGNQREKSQEPRPHRWSAESKTVAVIMWLVSAGITRNIAVLALAGHMSRAMPCIEDTGGLRDCGVSDGLNRSKSTEGQTL
jgi:hypothetical protein